MSRESTSPAGVAPPLHHDNDNSGARSASTGAVDKVGATGGSIFRIKPTPFVWTDPDTLARRQWLYGTHLIRREIAATVAPGGIGKTSLYIVEALALASGKPLLGIQPNQRRRVWIWNGEEPPEEMQRRIMAACKHHKLGPDDIDGWLFTDLGLQTPLVITEQTKNETKIQWPVVSGLVQALVEEKIDAMLVDPFVSTHNVNENDNNAVQKAASAWKQVAYDANAAIALAHHTRKLNGQDATADDGRGGSALRDKCRDVRALNPMSAADATRFGVNEFDRVDYFWTGPGGKPNMARRTNEKTWFRTVGEYVGKRNGNLDPGDSVGVVEAWTPPEINQELDPEHVEALGKVMGDRPWRSASLASERDDWIGVAVARAFGIETTEAAGKLAVKAKITLLERRGVIRKANIKNDQRKDVPVYFLQSAQPLKHREESCVRECAGYAGVEPAQESDT